jgi:hypothetical protein
METGMSATTLTKLTPPAGANSSDDTWRAAAAPQSPSSSKMRAAADRLLGDVEQIDRLLGIPNTLGHNLDLFSAIVGLILLPLGYVLARRENDRAPRRRRQK